MKQNLNYTTANSQCYGNNPANCDSYGRLYTWGAASTACPTGWHLPTDAEWCTLTTFIDPTINCTVYGTSGTDGGGKMKETGTTYWMPPNTGATNSSGFSARGGGSVGSSPAPIGAAAYFWSSSEYQTGIKWIRLFTI